MDLDSQGQEADLRLEAEAFPVPRGQRGAQDKTRAALELSGRTALDSLPEPQPHWFIRPNGYDASQTIHGVGHTRRVLIHACELADLLGVGGWELQALQAAALWHDIGRVHDGGDHFHGARSAGKVLGLGLHQGLEPQVYETALYAITHHCSGEKRGYEAARDIHYYQEIGEHRYERRWIEPAAALRVFKILKDADALDRVRLGGLDLNMLRHPESRERLDRAWELLRQVR